MRRVGMRSIVLVLAVGMLLAGCGDGASSGTAAGGSSAGAAGEPDRDAVLRWGVPGMPTSFDPRRSQPLDPLFLTSVYDSLVERTPAGDLEPGLATEWEVSEDETTITFTLREGVKFHDGSEMTAETVKATLEAYQAEGSLDGTFSTMESVEVVAPDQVTLTFSEPSGYMINVLAGEAGMMTTPEALADPDMATNPVGAGPFTLESLEEGKITYARFDDYWDAENTGVAGIEMTVFNDEATRLRAVQTGQSDGTTIPPGRIEEAETADLTVISGPSTTFQGLLLNTSVEPLTEPKVRQALLYALDRQAVNDGIHAGAYAPAVQPQQEGFPGNVPELNDTSSYSDPDKAKQLLAEAGYPDGIDLTIATGPNTSYQVLGQALQAQFEAAGIRVKLEVLEFQQMIEARRTGNFEAVVALLQSARPDSSQFIAEFYLPGGVYNAGGFELPNGEELLAQARASADVEERAVAFREAVTAALEAGPPVIPLFGVTWSAAFREGVTGMEVPSMSDYDFSSVQISAQ